MTSVFPTRIRSMFLRAGGAKYRIGGAGGFRQTTSRRERLTNDRKGEAMLVLTRRSGESILIGDDVRVRVLGSSGSRVRLGVEAPIDVRILREKAEPKPEPACTPAVAPADPLAPSDRLTAAVRRARPAGVPVVADRHTTLE